ncbi:DUF2130 domain-containing protein [Patescibacteria group bacterium]|nr:DUF2130 domain-containing protein [Patescibacteria group bacterium]
MNNNEIICPNCHTPISIDDVLTHQIENKLKKDFEDKERALRVSIEKENEKKLQTLTTDLTARVKADLTKEGELERKYLEEQVKEKDLKLKESAEKELELRRQATKLKEDKDRFELDKQRQLDEERKKIEEDASKRATESAQAQIDQLKKQNSDAIKANAELTRKLEQGSQQTQGEVQEMILEEMLKSEFIYDEIIPVPKGVNGADVIQIVKNQSGVECGKIIWESKKTKAWTEGWIQKLKDDQRTVKADLAVIVTSVLPNGADAISDRDGVWVCDLKLAISIATLLREQLLLIAREKAGSVGKNEKMEIIYSYLSGVEFRQRIEAIVEAFSSMKSTLDKEKLYFEKSWAEKEKQIQKVVRNTVGIYGDISGVVQLQKIEALELPAPKDEAQF